MGKIKKKWLEKIFIGTSVVGICSIPIATTFSSINFNNQVNSNLSLLNISVNSSNPTNYKYFFGKNHKDKIYKPTDMFKVGFKPHIKNDRLGSQRHYYLLLDFIFSFISLGKNVLTRNGVYQWNSRYAQLEGLLPSGSNVNDERTKVNLISPKLYYKSGKFHIDQTIYEKQDKQFRLINDTLNIESGTLLYRTKIASGFFHIFENLIYPKIHNKLQSKIKPSKNFKIDSSLAEMITYFIRALIVFATKSFFPIGQIIEGVFGSVSNNIKAALFCLLLSIIRPYGFVPYMTYALDYSMRVDWHANNEKINEYIIIKNMYVDNIEADALKVSSSVINGIFEEKVNIPEIDSGVLNKPKPDEKPDTKPDKPSDPFEDLDDKEREEAKKKINLINKLIKPLSKLLLKLLLPLIKNFLFPQLIKAYNLINNKITDWSRNVLIKQLFSRVYLISNEVYVNNEWLQSLIKDFISIFNSILEVINLIGDITNIPNDIKDKIEEIKKDFNEFKDKLIKYKEDFKKIIKTVRELIKKLFNKKDFWKEC